MLLHHAVHSAQGLTGFCKNNNTACRPVNPVGDPQENIPRFVVLFFQKILVFLAKGNIARFVALHNFRRWLIYQQQMIVLQKNI